MESDPGREKQYRDCLQRTYTCGARGGHCHTTAITPKPSSTSGTI